MSDKQFKLSSETVLQYKIMDNDTDLNESEVVDLLNSLSEKNEQLEKEHERKNNEIKLLRKKIMELGEDLEKIPPSIREVWLDE